MVELQLVIRIFSLWPGGKYASSSAGDRTSALSKTILKFSLKEPTQWRADSGDPSNMQDLASGRRQRPLRSCSMVPAEGASTQKTLEKLGEVGFQQQESGICFDVLTSQTFLQ